MLLRLLRRETQESPGLQYFPKLKLDSTSSPPAPKTNVDTNINVKNRTRRCAINKLLAKSVLIFYVVAEPYGASEATTKASSQTNAVVAEWQSACETLDLPFSLKTLRSVLTLPAT